MSILLNIKNYFTDTAAMSGRVLRHTTRSVDTIITVVAMPVFMMLMTVYVFGGAMNIGPIGYINFVVPGIILYTVASGVAYTSFRLNNDITAGIFDRFHSMPVSKSSILSGHVVTSVVFNAFSTFLVILIALLAGFRPEAGIVGWLLAAGIILLFTLAMTWLSVVFGLMAGSGEAAGVFAYPLLVLIFISSAFAPTETMPRFIRAFAERQPFTPIINTIRSLLMNEPVGNNAFLAVLWCGGILVVSYIAAMFIYKRKRA